MSEYEPEVDDYVQLQQSRVREGGGVHAEDISVIEIEPNKYRMYYAACDRHGSWRIASAIYRGPFP